MSETPCEACHGSRLKPEALAVKIAGKHIAEVSPAVDPAGASTGSQHLPAELADKQLRDRRSAS